MKNRIDQLFENKKGNILSVYFTAGFPQLDDTLTIAKELQNQGVDMLEIGIPFSDPLADGPMIQQSSEIALRNGMSISLLFEQLKGLRQHIHIPVILMGYFNPVLQYGVESFLQLTKQVGIDGLIIPDLPLKEYEEQYKNAFDQYQIKNALLITPQTSEERVRKIDALSGGFIYVVSSSSTTGQKENKLLQQIGYLEKVKSFQLKNPTLVGFGISTSADLGIVNQYTQGAIIGSAFVKAISGGQLETNISSFIQNLQS